MARIDELYWMFEGLLLGVFIVFITLPATATVFFEAPALAVVYGLGLILAPTLGWYYLSSHVLDRTTVDAVEHDALDSC